MFTLKKQAATVAHLNLREEKHGDVDVMAVDIKITADLPNPFLNQIAPGLLPAMYKAEDGQEPLLDDGHLPVLRFDTLNPLVFDLNAAKIKFTIHGAKKADDLEFEAKIKKITLDCKYGGTVSVTFKASVLPEPDQAGRLPGLMGQDVKISVAGGTVEQNTKGDIEIDDNEVFAEEE